MKLVETPITSNINLENLYPNITNYVFGKKAIKYYKLYSLDHVSIIYADTFDKVNVIMMGKKRKIKKQEIDFVIKKLLHTTRDEVKIYLDVKHEMQVNGIPLNEPRKDILLLQKEQVTE